MDGKKFRECVNDCVKMLESLKKYGYNVAIMRYDVENKAHGWVTRDVGIRRLMMANYDFDGQNGLSIKIIDSELRCQMLDLARLWEKASGEEADIDEKYSKIL